MAFLLIALPARADTPLPRVEIALAGSTPNSLGDRISSWFHRPTTLAPTQHVPSLDPATIFARTENAGVRVWIATEPGVARLVFVVQEHVDEEPRFLVREVTLDNGLDELGVEKLAQVVYLSALGLWAGNLESTRSEVEQAIGARPPPPPPTVNEEPPPPPFVIADEHEHIPLPVPRTFAVRVGAEYDLSFSGDAGTTHAVAAAFDAMSLASDRELGGRMRAALLFPHEVEKSGTALDLRGLRFDAGGVVAKRISAKLWIPAELGASVATVMYRTGAVATGFKAKSGATDIEPLIYGRGGVRYELGAVRVGVEALLTMHVLRTHYDVSENGHRTALVTPWPVEPGISAVAAW
jgi:hypothetical protein